MFTKNKTSAMTSLFPSNVLTCDQQPEILKEKKTKLKISYKTNLKEKLHELKILKSWKGKLGALKLPNVYVEDIQENKHNKN